MNKRSLGLTLFLLLASPALPAWETLTGNLDLNCIQPAPSNLDCSYRLLIPEPPLSIDARHEQQKLAISERRSYPRDDSITAVVLLVDTSDPARQPVIDRNKRQIRRILDSAAPHHRIGLASFDKALRMEAPIGSGRAGILAAADSLRATGMTTELYRSLLKAIELLAGVEAERKAVYLFSDGQAEDRAYFHQDVIRAARKQQVVINSLGFQRSLALSVALQTLRRLSEETGGRYIEADRNHVLPQTFLDNPFDNIDRGGRFRIDIGPLASLPGDRSSIELRFATDLGNIAVQVPVTLPAAGDGGGRAPAAPAPTPQVVPPIQIATTPSEQEADGLDSWLWYGVPIALLVLVTLTVLTLVLLLRRPVSKKAAPAPHPEQPKPYAYLISQDEKGTRYPITRTTWRIGRSRDNEMTLDDNSVSRRHAEIQRLPNGRFMVYDHDSLNGVFVNDTKIGKHKLEEGDIIEIGDFYLRFTEHPSDYQLGEETVMLRTRAPSRS